MSGKTLAIVLIGVSLIFYTAGEYTSKLWSLKPSWSLFITTLIAYSTGASLWLPALREHGQLSALSAVWSCLSISICVGLGVFVFGEQLSPRQIAGLVLALLATILTF